MAEEPTSGGRTFLPKLFRKTWNPAGRLLTDVGDDVTEFDVVKRLEKEISFSKLKKLHQHIKEKEKIMDTIDELRSTIADNWVKTSYFKEYGELTKEIAHLANPPPPTDVQIDLGGKKITIPYPVKLRISSSADIRYDAAYIWSDDVHWERLEKALKQHIMDSRLNDNTQIVGHVMRSIESLILKAKQTSEEFKEMSKEFIGEISTESGVKALLTQIHDKKGELFKKRLTSKEVEFAHTYRVIRPLTAIERRQLLSGGFGSWSGREADEIEHDSNGWPLEVNDSGEVLIDIFLKNGKNRRIPKEWIIDCDAIDIANWLYSEYDAYISDLRDGRYHSKSVSVFDWIMTDLKVDHVSHSNSRSNLLRGNQAVVSIPKQGSGSEKMPLAPTHLNPAFDLRPSREIPLHKGRIYYYDSQEYCIQSDEPMISSRGAALYIVHMCIQHIKYVDNQPFSKGVLDTIEHISKSTGGLDLGANIDTFGKEYTDPFKK